MKPWLWPDVSPNEPTIWPKTLIPVTCVYVEVGTSIVVNWPFTSTYPCPCPAASTKSHKLAQVVDVADACAYSARHVNSHVTCRRYRRTHGCMAVQDGLHTTRQ